MAETFGSRLKKVREKQHFTAKQLAKPLGVQEGSIYRWESGERNPRISVITKIASILGVKIADLLVDDGLHSIYELDDIAQQNDISPEELYTKGAVGIPSDEKTIKNAAKVYEARKRERLAEAANLKPITLSGDDVLSIPKISAAFKVCAGAGFVYDDVQWEHNGRLIVQDGELAALYSEQSLTAMAVEGDSMYPKFHDGDFVIFNHSPDWITGKAYVVSLDGRLMLKVLVSQGEGKPPKLHSLNPDYADIKVTEDNQLFIIGEVLRVARMERVGFIG